MQQAQLIELLTRFSQAWNQHDIEQLMACMHPECRFETVAGDDVYGTRIEGLDAVRQAFSNTFKSFPDAQWRNCTHWISENGEFGISETTFMSQWNSKRYFELLSWLLTLKFVYFAAQSWLSAQRSLPLSCLFSAANLEFCSQPMFSLLQEAVLTFVALTLLFYG